MKKKDKRPTGHDMRKLPIDVMDRNGRFICTLRFPYCPLFRKREQKVSDFVTSKLPTLKNKQFTIAF